MREQRAKLSRGNNVAKAMDYMLKRWIAFPPTHQRIEGGAMKANTVERPAQPAGATIHARACPRQQRERGKAIRRLFKLREKASAEIERLIALSGWAKSRVIVTGGNE
jgi:hypothetical protein